MKEKGIYTLLFKSNLRFIISNKLIFSLLLSYSVINKVTEEKLECSKSYSLFIYKLKSLTSSPIISIYSQNYLLPS
jgi:hypothetical protein